MSELVSGQRDPSYRPPLQVPSLSFSLSSPPEESPGDNGTNASSDGNDDSVFEKRRPKIISEEARRKGSIPPENSPLLGTTELGMPMPLGRRPSTQIFLEGGGMNPEFGSSISAFLMSKSESENLAALSGSDSEERM